MKKILSDSFRITIITLIIIIFVMIALTSLIIPIVLAKEYDWRYVFLYPVAIFLTVLSFRFLGFLFEELIDKI